MTQSAPVANLAYAIYRAASRVAAPALYYLSDRRKRNKYWKQRLGYPSAPPRPPETTNRLLFWFHAVSLGEAFSALPLIHHCSVSYPCYDLLFTTSTLSSFEIIKDRLPDGVIFQIAPIDTPKSIQRFLSYWNPNVIFLIESELWPNLILHAADKGIKLALLNARISKKSFDRWSTLALPLISLMLSKFSLIAPLSNIEAMRFQLLGASPSIIHFAGDLKYAVGDYLMKDNKENNILNEIKMQIGNKPTWLAASIHLGEEKVMLQVHKELIKIYPKLILILVTRHPQDGRNIALELKAQKVNIALRSKNEIIGPNTSIYIVDTLGELRYLYKASEIAVIGGSFLHNLNGHNFSEAAAASCAVLAGPHIGHFKHMLNEMRRINSLSIKQVGGEEELVEYIKMLLSDKSIREAHKKASKYSFDIMSKGIVNSIWTHVQNFVLD